MTREEQIELMKECLEDAGDLVSGSTEILLESDESRCSLAAAFFQYRAGQRDWVVANPAYIGVKDAADIPGDTPDNTPDVEED